MTEVAQSEVPAQADKQLEADTQAKQQNEANCINVEELAERVYALLKRELLIEHERLGRR